MTNLIILVLSIAVAYLLGTRRVRAPKGRRVGRVCRTCGIDISWKRGGRALCQKCRKARAARIAAKVSRSLTPEGILQDDHDQHQNGRPVELAEQAEPEPVKVCKCGCGTPLIGKQRMWASNTHRMWFLRNGTPHQAS